MSVHNSAHRRFIHDRHGWPTLAPTAPVVPTYASRQPVAHGGPKRDVALTDGVPSTAVRVGERDLSVLSVIFMGRMRDSVHRSPSYRNRNSVTVHFHYERIPREERRARAKSETC